jgi:hypothetical protein
MIIQPCALLHESHQSCVLSCEVQYAVFKTVEKDQASGLLLHLLAKKTLQAASRNKVHLIKVVVLY